MRRPMVMGNWKMHLDGTTAEVLAREIVEGLKGRQVGVDVGVCPPYVYLDRLSSIVEGSPVILGAQNGHFAEKGAFTGEISMDMLVDVGCDYVIIGHSERRHYAGEPDSEIRKKISAGLNRRLRVILCVGETEPQRDQGVTRDVIEGQLEGALSGFSCEDIERLVLAYEPVWAIGTGKTATPEQAQEVHDFIRGWVASAFGLDFAQRLRILYGGSVKPENMRSLIEKPDIDGALVGGASLKSGSFLEIIYQAAQGGN